MAGLLPGRFQWPAPRTLRDGLYWQEPRIRTEWEARIADRPAIGHGSVIYYLELDNTEEFIVHNLGPGYLPRSPVKIGYTVDLDARIRSVEKTWGKVFVAATEPGGRATEQLRHWQFMASRMPSMPLPGGSEFFELSDVLDAHITWLLEVKHWPAGQCLPRPSLPGMEVPA